MMNRDNSFDHNNKCLVLKMNNVVFYFTWRQGILSL